MTEEIMATMKKIVSDYADDYVRNEADLPEMTTDDFHESSALLTMLVKDAVRVARESGYDFQEDFNEQVLDTFQCLSDDEKKIWHKNQRRNEL